MSSTPDYTERLRSQLQAANLSSFQALCRAAQVSKWQVNQLRRGHVGQMRVDVLQRLGNALQLSLPELIHTFSQPSNCPPPTAQATPTNPADGTPQEMQQAALQILESLLIQLPTVRHSLANKPDVPATRLLPLLRPLDELLDAWGIEAIAPVGATVPYDPSQHQLLDGDAQPGEPVRIRYTGYVQGDRLLYRAKVSPIR